MLNKKIKKLLVGTNNEGKLKEITDLLPKTIKILSTKDFKLRSPKENSKKLRIYSQKRLKLILHLSLI